MCPIFLTSCFLKILEKLILNRLDNRIFPSPHSQFVKKFRSCQDNLTILTAIYEGLALGSPAVAVFVDIKSAFDNILLHILVNDLLELQFPLKTVKFRKSHFL